MVFLSTCDSVDYHHALFTAMEPILGDSEDDNDADEDGAGNGGGGIAPSTNSTETFPTPSVGPPSNLSSATTVLCCLPPTW